MMATHGFAIDAPLLGSGAPPPQQRAILADLTFRYRGRRYSVAHLPLAEAGRTVLVSPEAAGRVAVTFPGASLPGISASAGHARNQPRSGRAASRPSHSGTSPSGRKMRAKNPRQRRANDPAMPPAQLRLRTTDMYDEEKAWTLAPLPDSAPEPARQSRTGRTGNGNRRS